MHNLGTVLRFEMTRTLKKKSFWISALSMPIVLAVIALIIFFANKATDEQAENLAKEQFSLGVTDDSQLVSPQLLGAVKAKTFTSKEAGQSAVQSGELDAYFYYPKDITKEPVTIYAKNVGLFKNNRYEATAGQLLEQSVAGTTKPSVALVLKDKVSYSATTYNSDGTVDEGFMNLIAPGLFLVLFYFMIATFGNQMLTSVTEEKENRVIEMILATIKPTTLLVGKLFSLIFLALIQVVVILVPIVAGYIFLHDQLTLPNIDLSSIPVDAMRVAVGAAVFMVSFLLFAGILMTIGAAMPTAKEAGSFFGTAMIFLFGPLYAAPLFITSPESLVVQVLSYFPLTAPIPLLLRNAVGNLSVLEAGIAIAIMTVTAAVVIAIGVRIFRFGALEYSRKLSVKEVIGRKG